MARAGKRAHARTARDAVAGHERGERTTEAAGKLILAARLAVTMWEVIRALIESESCGGPGRIL
jgi:hypothetical protein